MAASNNHPKTSLGPTKINAIFMMLSPIVDELSKSAKYKQCTRCFNDSGYISAFSHVKGGVCFKCGGSGRQCANKAARDKSAIISHWNSIRYSWKLKIYEIESVQSYKDLMETLGKVSNKYKKKSYIINPYQDSRDKK